MTPSDLPELPNAIQHYCGEWAYTADQMREYALKARTALQADALAYLKQFCEAANESTDALDFSLRCDAFIVEANEFLAIQPKD